MVADVPGAIGRVAEVAPGVQGWPARSAAYYGLFVIILATARMITKKIGRAHV